LPPVIRRRGSLFLALALALSAFAVEAPAVFAGTTASSEQTGAVAWSGPGEVYFDDWLLASLAEGPAADSPDSDLPVGWHTTSNTAGHLPAGAPKPKPKPTVRSEARKIIRLARRAIGADFRMGAVGGRIGRQTYFDCSGLVYAVYKDAGLLSKVGGSRRGATSFYQWFKNRGLVSRNHGKPGDLVVYQHKGEGVIPHIGIYIGHGRVISALIMPWGVRAHGLRSIGIPFKGFLHVRINR
jgi:cell wall-associated NlpC family hydrolase